MNTIFHGATQDYPASGFAENAITQSLNIFTQHIMVTYENDQDYRNSGFAENNITLDHNICTQNIGITYEKDIPWGQIKITQHLDSQKIRFYTGPRYFQPEHMDYI